jgi:hypothetical protein
VISATALTHENIVTCAAGGALMKLSLKKTPMWKQMGCGETHGTGKADGDCRVRRPAASGEHQHKGYRRQRQLHAAGDHHRRRGRGHPTAQVIGAVNGQSDAEGYCRPAEKRAGVLSVGHSATPLTAFPVCQTMVYYTV